MSPKYDSVPDDPQLPSRPRASLAAQQAATEAPRAPLRPAPPPAAPDLVTITVAVPPSVRQAMKVACAVKGVTMQGATAEAFRMWLAMQGVTVTDDPA
jgi:hypothetical protein